MNDDLPKIPEGRVFLLTRQSAQKLVAAIRRRTPKVASGAVEVVGPDGPIKVFLGIRKADDGTTISLREMPLQDDSSSSESSFSDEVSSEVSEPSGSDSTPDESISEESSKTAIVRFRDENIGWNCAEKPGNDFEDVVEVHFRPGEKSAWLDLEPEMVECCEPGSIRVVSAMPDALAFCTATISDNAVFASVGGGEPVAKVTVRICGTRKGFPGRWRRYSDVQRLANTAFYNLARLIGLWT